MQETFGTIWIRGARLLDPASGTDRTGDLTVTGDEVAFGEPAREPDRVIDAGGLVAVPGFVEIHAHLRDPGFPESETIATGLAAALAGGYTAVVCMANTNPPNDSPAITATMLSDARRSGLPVRLFPAAAATVGLEGREVADYPAQKAAGAVAVTDDGFPILDDEVMAACMAAAAAAGLPIMDHATHGPKSGKGVVHDGPAARDRGLAGLPREEEDSLIARDIRIAEETGHPIHIQHISTAGGAELIRRAKARGVPVTSEVAPHHLVLTDRDAVGPDFKMNPPIREESDRDALVRALVDGSIDAVATDHAPHAPDLKARGMDRAPFGVIGMESAFAVVHEELVVKGPLTLLELIRLMTVGPAGVLGIPAGSFETPGAGVNLLDLETMVRFEEKHLRSKSRNCPFLGRELRGRVVATVVGGAVFEHGPERFRTGGA